VQLAASQDGPSCMKLVRCRVERRYGKETGKEECTRCNCWLIHKSLCEKSGKYGALRWHHVYILILYFSTVLRHCICYPLLNMPPIQ
jgi:hypothetical protein